MRVLSAAEAHQKVPASAPNPFLVDGPLRGHGLKSLERPSASVMEMAGCRQVVMDGRTMALCIQSPPQWRPLADAAPGVVTAILGFLVVHHFSVRRQRRDEQFKLLTATRDLLGTVSKDVDAAWGKRSGRRLAGHKIIQGVASVSSAVNMLRLRHDKLDCTLEMVSFRQAATNDFEAGSVAIDRRVKIAQAKSALDEALLRKYISLYG